MGYTHYFLRPKELGPKDKFRLCAEDCRKVVEHLAETRAIPVCSDYDDPSPAVFSEDEVRFNGVGTDGHETFFIPRIFEPEKRQKPDDHGRYFDFCKTARKLYDSSVCACLMVFHRWFGLTFRIASDGDWGDVGWTCARMAYAEVFGYDGEFDLENDDEGD